MAILILVGLILGILLPGPVWALSEAYRDAWDLMDAESLRWLGVHRQQTSRTCGPATLVTLLTYYYGIPVTEEEAARRALGLAPAEATPERLSVPASMRGLRDALRSWGLTAYGVKMPVEGLAAYLREQERPILVRIVHPEPHFTLLTGIVRDHAGEHHLLMADSSLGWRVLPLQEFAVLWDGYGLVIDSPAPPPPAVPGRLTHGQSVEPAGDVRRSLDTPPVPSVQVEAGLRHHAREAEELKGRLDHLQRGLPW